MKVMSSLSTKSLTMKYCRKDYRSQAYSRFVFRSLNKLRDNNSCYVTIIQPNYIGNVMQYYLE